MKLTDALLVSLYEYHIDWKKDDAQFLEIYEDKDLLNQVKNFDLNTLIEPNFKDCVLSNEWYEWYCKNEHFKSPMHYVYNENGLTVKDIIENIKNTIVEGDHVFFEMIEWKGKMWYNLPVFEIFYGS